jgi:hypothetical protein
MSSGYSGKSLVEKLGIKAGSRALFVGAPDGYTAGLGLPVGVTVATRGRGPFAFIQIFVRTGDELNARLSAAKKVLTTSGMLWVSWPKRTSGVRTDIDENDVRGTGLLLGLVDVKVCAVDDTWSALKFVIPLKNR